MSNRFVRRLRTVRGHQDLDAGRRGRAADHDVHIGRGKHQPESARHSRIAFGETFRFGEAGTRFPASDLLGCERA
jgi:hypothetical protein